ncbi:hypothetical protein AVEN_63478-1 [Araneus ventricosus]|uniref:Uncharacterized protein n=1 Tax=Araneus ventricosus TaxID=182803 RepID=A0A4Y2CSX2_ARAVE|nr:hypothetical protein AVEN_63478-1 [Araneus ventricosus]
MLTLILQEQNTLYIVLNVEQVVVLPVLISIRLLHGKINEGLFPRWFSRYRSPQYYLLETEGWLRDSRRIQTEPNSATRSCNIPWNRMRRSIFICMVGIAQNIGCFKPFLSDCSLLTTDFQSKNFVLERTF